MDGWAVLGELKADASWPRSRAAVHPGDENNRAYALGAADFLTKRSTGAGSRRCCVASARQTRGPRTDHRRRRPEPPAAGPHGGQRGWTCTEAENGRVSLKCIAEEPPDLILLDLMMPEMDGFDLVRIIRKTQAGRSIPS